MKVRFDGQKMQQADSQRPLGNLKPRRSVHNDTMPKPFEGELSEPVGPRCQPDLFDSSVECTTNETNDKRLCISHFFGRNKLHTATIPRDYFPVLCRKHYQEKRSRWEKDLGAYAAFQCDNILKVLGNMAKKVFVDDHDNKWPWWCGFELRLPSLPDTETSRIAVPPWLSRMCSEAIENSTESSNAPRSLRCDLLQLVQIVKALKIWCVDTNSRLPEVEALPVTVGMVDKRALNIAEKNLKKFESQSNVLRNDWHRLEESSRAYHTLPGPVNEARQAFERSLQDVENAKQNVVFASADFEASAITLPAKRAIKTGSGHDPKRPSRGKAATVKARRDKRKSSTEPDKGNGE